ncbi:hypothetical protein OAC96_01920 [Candidatus Pelagibacter sp.]|nr:hypothetical protein [Candidatus Pelagibacter sp.]
MKKLFLILVLSVLFSGNAFAGVNEPGVTSIAGCDKSLKYQFKKIKKKHSKEFKEKKQTFVLYASCDYDKYSWAANKGKNLEKLHKKTYKQCMKNSKKHTGKECYLYALNEEIVWKYDKALDDLRVKTKIAEAKALEEKNTKMDKKPGRFFEDQPDVNDDYQIHFNYLLAQDSEDRELDINGKMEKIILMMNKWMEISTSKNKKGDNVPRKYKLDYRSDGKLDITFIRIDKNFKDLHKWANNDITPFLYKKKGQTNNKKIYFNFADINSVDGGEAGVGFGSIFLRNKSVRTDKRKAAIALHELLHTQGMGTNCMPWIKSSNLKSHSSHLKNEEKRSMLSAVDPSSPKIGKIYSHDIDMCPQFKDSVYLTPTRKDSYDPYKIFCLFELGKYKHPNYLKIINKLKEAGLYNWKTRFGPSCSTRNMDKDGQGYYLLGVEGNILKKINY